MDGVFSRARLLTECGGAEPHNTEQPDAVLPAQADEAHSGDHGLHTSAFSLGCRILDGVDRPRQMWKHTSLMALASRGNLIDANDGDEHLCR